MPRIMQHATRNASRSKDIPDKVIARPLGQATGTVRVPSLLSRLPASYPRARGSAHAVLQQRGRPPFRRRRIRFLGRDFGERRPKHKIALRAVTSYLRILCDRVFVFSRLRALVFSRGAVNGGIKVTGECRYSGDAQVRVRVRISGEARDA